jgi:hypothetical protein
MFFQDEISKSNFLFFRFLKFIGLPSSTTTSKELKIICIEDKNFYELGIGVPDTEFEEITLVREEFHGNWNYRILPNK